MFFDVFEGLSKTTIFWTWQSPLPGQNTLKMIFLVYFGCPKPWFWTSLSYPSKMGFLTIRYVFFKNFIYRWVDRPKVKSEYYGFSNPKYVIFDLWEGHFGPFWEPQKGPCMTHTPCGHGGFSKSVLPLRGKRSLEKPSSDPMGALLRFEVPRCPKPTSRRPHEPSQT